MQTPRFSLSSLSTSFRRTSHASSSPNRDSACSATSAASSSSSVSAINTIIFRQPSIVGLHEERERFPSGLDVLEPRPIVYWGSVEERMGALAC